MTSFGFNFPGGNKVSNVAETLKEIEKQNNGFNEEEMAQMLKQ